MKVIDLLDLFTGTDNEIWLQVIEMCMRLI